MNEVATGKLSSSLPQPPGPVSPVFTDPEARPLSVVILDNFEPISYNQHVNLQVGSYL